MQYLRKKTKKITLLGTVLLAVSLIIAAQTSFAHGLGTSKQATSGEYTLEFEYDALEQVPAGKPVFYSLRLLNKNGGGEQAYDVAFLRISSSKNASVFSANLSPAPDIVGVSKFVVTLPEPDTYNATVSFLRAGKPVAESTFSYTAIPNDDDVVQFGLSLRHWGLIIVSLLFGISAGLLIKTKKKS